MSIFSPNTEKYEPAITPYVDTFHVVSKKIIEEINERNNICLNMQPPEDLKGGPICRWSEFSYPRHQWSLRENINPYCFTFKNIYKL